MYLEHSVYKDLFYRCNTDFKCHYFQPYRLVLGLALLLLSTLTAVGNGMVLHAIREIDQSPERDKSHLLLETWTTLTVL